MATKHEFNTLLKRFIAGEKFLNGEEIINRKGEKEKIKDEDFEKHFEKWCEMCKDLDKMYKEIGNDGFINWLEGYRL